MSATMSKSLPDAAAVAESFGMLFGENINVVPSKTHASGHMGVFSVGDEEAACLMIGDMPFQCLASAKLLMIPAGGAKDMAASGEPNQSIKEGFYEIINISSTLFPISTELPVTLQELKDDKDYTADDEGYPNVASFKVTIPGYGDGLITLLAR